LKKKYKALRAEYVRVLESWEDQNKRVRDLNKERKFLRAKLETFMQIQV
jgi:uncharacterized protein YlxW (UPF0749 family)